MRFTTRILGSAAGVFLALLLGFATWAGTAASAAPAGQTASPVVYPFNFSRIAWTGSAAVIAATDSHGDLYYFWQRSGTTTWHKQLVAAGGKAVGYHRPSISWTGAGLAIAVVNSAGDLLYFSQLAGRTAWTHHTLLTAAAAGGQYQAPSIAGTAGGGAVITVGNSLGSLTALELTPGAPSWLVRTVAYGIFGPSSVSSTAIHAGPYYKAYFTAAAGGTLYEWAGWVGDSATQWIQLRVGAPGPSGSFTGGSIVADSNNANSLVAADTTTGGIDAWVNGIKETVAAGGGGVTYASPQVAITPTFKIRLLSYFYEVVTATDQSGNLEFWWKRDDGTSWTPERVATAGKLAAYATPGITVTSSSIVITAINRKPGNVVYWYQAYGTNPWHPQLVAKG